MISINVYLVYPLQQACQASVNW